MQGLVLAEQGFSLADFMRQCDTHFRILLFIFNFTMFQGVPGFGQFSLLKQVLYPAG